MTEHDPTEHGPDELYLQGRLQVEAARDALLTTGLNPTAAGRFTAYLDAHNILSDGEDQCDSSLYTRGGDTKQMKADIISSLETITAIQGIGVEAARGLLSLLTDK